MRRYQKAAQSLKDSLNLAKLIEKFGEELGYEKWAARCWKSHRQSKIAEDLFASLPEAEYEKPIFLNRENRLALGQKIMFVDYTLGSKIIEFFGDAFHGNPKVFEDTVECHPFRRITAKELQTRDATRINILKEKGFDVMVVWEKDFKDDKMGVINKCKEWLS